MIHKLYNYLRTKSIGDEMHEHLKNYNYKCSQGHIKYRDDRFVWICDQKACWQNPKGSPPL